MNILNDSRFRTMNAFLKNFCDVEIVYEKKRKRGFRLISKYLQ